jgi:hypothetical protein
MMRLDPENRYFPEFRPSTLNPPVMRWPTVSISTLMTRRVAFPIDGQMEATVRLASSDGGDKRATRRYCLRATRMPTHVRGLGGGCNVQGKSTHVLEAGQTRKWFESLYSRLIVIEFGPLTDVAAMSGRDVPLTLGNDEYHGGPGTSSMVAKGCKTLHGQISPDAIQVSQHV